MTELIDETQPRRAYNSPRRQAQSAETRRRIIAAGTKLLGGSSVRNWHSPTIRAIAQEAGVNERTVYRHFSDERGLRDAVMRSLEGADIDLADLQLEDIADVASRIFVHISSYSPAARPPMDPTMAEATCRQREALHDALGPWTATWPAPTAAAVAALFDVLWSVGSYERLVAEWQLRPEEAIRVLTWAIGLVEEAVRAGRRPQLSERAPRGPDAEVPCHTGGVDPFFRRGDPLH